MDADGVGRDAVLPGGRKAHGLVKDAFVPALNPTTSEFVVKLPALAN